MSKLIPNPQSKLLAGAVIGGIGIDHDIPTYSEPPPNMATVLLYVPIDRVLGQNPIELQADLGLPWYVENSEPVWLDELIGNSM